MKYPLLQTVVASSLLLAATGVFAAEKKSTTCAGLPDHAKLATALKAAVNEENSGLNLNMWATIVDRDGIVCAVAYSGSDRAAQWPGSRIISAQKANTANAFSLDADSVANGSGKATGLVLSTANLYSAVQPGGSLYGLQHSNPVNTETAYSGNPAHYGQPNDPLVGLRIGGINVFGGGVALYTEAKKLIGGLGVSGDTSCADHNIGWRVRNKLGLDNLNGISGVSGDATRPDNIVLLNAGETPNGFKHPQCVNTAGSDALPVVR